MKKNDIKKNRFQGAEPLNSLVCTKFHIRTIIVYVTINDIEHVSEFLYTILYADDTCVLLNGKNYMNLMTFLNSELDKVST